MFTKFMTVAALIALASNGLAADSRMNPRVGRGQCFADTSSKRYLDNLASPSTISFVCDYKCIDNSGDAHTVKAIGTADRARAESGGNEMVCDGVVVIERKRGVWDFDGVRPFFARQSMRPEIFEWARSNRVQIPTSERQVLEAEFFTLAQKLGQAYLQAGQSSEVFRNAGLELLEVASQTETGKRHLNARLTELSQNPVPRIQPFTADTLVLNVIATHGRFMIP